MDYTRAAQTADRMLRSAGRAAILSRRPEVGYNPNSSQAARGQEQQFPITVVTLQYSAREIDGTNIRTGDVRALTSSKETPPEVGDTVTIDGVAYRVIDPRPLNPGGVVLLYDMQLRRA